MTHLDQIKQAIRRADRDIADYESTVRFMKGLTGSAPQEMIDESRERMSESLAVLTEIIIESANIHNL